MKVEKPEKKLLYLIPEADDLTFTQYITKENGVLSTQDYYNGIKIEDMGHRHTFNIETKDARVGDALKSYSIFINDQICDSNRTNEYGKALIGVVSYKEKKNAIWTFASIWTLCTINFFGFPLREVITELEINVSIIDNKGNFIKNYFGKGNGIAYLAMYWGYGEDVRRKASLDAFTEAFTEIQNNITKDIDYINDKLINQNNN
ncbi:MAG: hypothetical protein KDD29_00960 [Flavobacteriales bacterium]|nr:hypothetical protein [Flavobacteriales bacterium]MCB9334861.1 hypothetical protein [Flavobacteriales bacterium]